MKRASSYSDGSSDEENSSNNSSIKSAEDQAGNGPVDTSVRTNSAGNLKGDEDEQDQPEEPRRPQQKEEEGEQVADQEILPGTTQNAEDATSYQKRWAELYNRLVAFKEVRFGKWRCLQSCASLCACLLMFSCCADFKS